jgi:hypothetical protein
MTLGYFGAIASDQGGAVGSALYSLLVRGNSYDDLCGTKCGPSLDAPCIAGPFSHMELSPADVLILVVGRPMFLPSGADISPASIEVMDNATREVRMVVGLGSAWAAGGGCN